VGDPRRLLVILASIVFLVLWGSGSSAFGSDGTFSGKLVGIHTDDFAHGRSTFRYGLATAQGTLELRFADDAPVIPSASEVTVHGSRNGNTITVAAGGIQAAGSTTATAPTTGVRKVAVILVTFADNATQPYTPAFAQGVAFTNSNSVAAYYSTASWGQLSLSGDVFGWYQIAAKSTSCDYSTWASQANSAAAAAGVDLSGYTNVVYGFPNTSACPWAGLAYMPGSQAWLNGTLGMNLHGMAHELGHSFGTHHANAYYCTENGVRVSLSASTANCTSQEYGDPFSVMGNYSSSSHYEHTNFARGNLGWLSAASTLDVGKAGTYTLDPIEPSDPAGVQALRIKRDASTYFLLELRQPSTSFDTFGTTDPAVNGVMIRIVPSYSTLSQSQLVDATPGTSSYYDAALAVGRSLYDPYSKVTITTTAISSSGATVQITFGSNTSTGSDTTPPSSPTGLSASASDSSHISLSWGASSDNVGVAGYKIYRGGTYVTTTTSTSFTDSGLTASTSFSYQVTAVDAAGNEGLLSNTATATTPAAATTADLTPPSAPTNLAGSQNGNSPHVSLAWGASTDNVAVAGYRIYRNGSLVATVSGTTLSFLDGKAPKGTDAYDVVAVDSAGNASAPSNTVSVSL
jgi:chitodextrinase